MDLFNLNIEKANTSNAVNESRMKVLKGLQEAVKSAENSMDESRKKEIEKAARGFESIMINQMIKEMKKAMLEKKKENDDDTFGGDTLLDYTDMLVSDHLSKTGSGIGIASKIYGQLTGGEKLGAITSAYYQLNKIENLNNGEDDE